MTKSMYFSTDFQSIWHITCQLNENMGPFAFSLLPKVISYDTICDFFSTDAGSTEITCFPTPLNSLKFLCGSHSLFLPWENVKWKTDSGPRGFQRLYVQQVQVFQNTFKMQKGGKKASAEQNVQVHELHFIGSLLKVYLFFFFLNTNRNIPFTLLCPLYF